MAEADPAIEQAEPVVRIMKPALAVRLDAVLKVKPFISQNLARYYLNGVRIEACSRGGALCVSTDGHRMGVQRDQDGLVLEPLIIRVPGEMKIAKRKNGRRSPWLVVMFDGKKGHASIVDPAARSEDDTAEAAFERIEDCTMRFGNVVIDGTYPDWKRIIPAEKPDALERTFNGKYLKDFGSALSISGADAASPHIVQTDDPGFLGIIMPVRTIGRPMPDWLSS